MERIRIFISSVQSEFAEERAMLCHYIRTDALLGKFFEPFIFEEVPANEYPVDHVYLKEVEASDIYLGLYGNQYGYEDEEGVSPTEREYDVAKLLHKSRLIYIKGIDEDKRHPKETALITKVERDIVRKTFVDIDGLRTSVYASLIRYLEEKEFIRFRPFDASFDNGATMADLDEDKIRSFVQVARSKRNFPLTVDTPIKELLVHLDLIDENEKITNAAILLFGKKPQKYFIPSEVKCVQFYGDVVRKPMPAYQIYRGDVFELVDQATDFVMSRVDNWVGTRDKGDTASVPTHPELPIDAVKEAIVNAVCHRDYTSNASVQVMLFRNRLEIWNPGQLPYGLTVQKLQGPHKSLPTNPLIADPMYWKGYIEKVGTGTEDIIEKCRNYGLKAPEFYQEEDFRVVIWRRKDAQSAPEVIQSDPEAIQSDPEVIKLIELIKANPSISRAELARKLGLSERQTRKIIDKLRTEGILLRQGGDYNGKWVIVYK
ncbi:MAG: DUF4062 domain-containing protein, partial [Bacteroidales bacterium]|nr:DUF4062 domain-containing protein [Bacteroidales bacterium]